MGIMTMYIVMSMPNTEDKTKGGAEWLSFLELQGEAAVSKN